MSKKLSEADKKDDPEMKGENEEVVCDLRSLDLPELTMSQIQSTSCPVLQESAFTVVTQLLLDYNDLKRIPAEISKLRHLKKLSVIGNQLDCLPERVGELKSLEILNLNENHLTELPSWMQSLIELKVLSAVANRIKVIEKGSLIQMKNLEELYLDENMLNTFSEDLGCLESLQILESSQNQLLGLPENFGNLQDLHTLDLDSNNISDLPQGFSMLKNLRILLLSDNNLKELPDDFGSAKTLKKLIIDKNNLSRVPDWFGSLQNITELSMNDNELSGKILSEKFCVSASDITSLSAGRNYMTKLPENMGLLKKLQVLHLGSTMPELERSNFQSGNWLSSLPESFTELLSLRQLHLDENQIHSLPESIGKLQSLEWLDLGQNQLKTLPDSFCQLTRLTYLQLSKNRLKCLPANIGNLNRLEELRVDSNMLTEIPESLFQMSLLHSLDLFHNHLNEFPKQLFALKSLKRLDVERNNFSTYDLPKLIKGNVYPERDSSLKDNWRGKTRKDKEKCIVIEMPDFDKECEEYAEDKEESFCSTEHNLIASMKAGMSLWRHHGAQPGRQLPSPDDVNTRLPESDADRTSAADVNSEAINSGDLQLQKYLASHSEPEEDWDEEVKREHYQEMMDTCSARSNVSSPLIDSFQSNLNRYPPCLHAFSPTACYDSLVYRNAEKAGPAEAKILQQVEGQYDDACT